MAIQVFINKYLTYARNKKFAEMKNMPYFLLVVYVYKHQRQKQSLCSGVEDMKLLDNAVIYLMSAMVPVEHMALYLLMM